MAELFTVWWERHGNRSVAVSELHEDVRLAADPHNRGRQQVASQLQKLLALAWLASC